MTITALVHGMTVATRNGADFSATGIALVNPWQAGICRARDHCRAAPLNPP